MKDRKFKTGDIVRLIGSRRHSRMTVSQYDASGGVVCRWFVENQLCTATFIEDSLQQQDDDEHDV